MATSRGFFLLCVCLLASCSQPRIDTTTDETSQASIARVRESLPETQRARFDTALQVLAFSELNLGSLVEAAVPGASGTVSRIKGLLNGKTGAEVLAAADSIVSARVEKEIQELDNRRIAAERARGELAKFVVLRSRFHTQKTMFTDFPIIEMTVRNGTAHPISRAYFVGTLASPGRTIPWVKDDFTYYIRGGLEPGEQASWRIHVSEFSGWGSDKIPSNSVLTVEVVRLDGANEETLFSTTDFTAEDKAKLDSLRAKFPAR